MSSEPVSVADLRSQADSFVQTNNNMNGYFYIMLDRLQNEITKNNKLKEVIEAEKQSHALSRVEAQQLQEEIKKYKRNAEELLVKNQFVVLLVDGDGAKFSDDLLKDSVSGAQRAAENTRKAIRSYLHEEGLSDDVTIIVRIFAHLKGLAKALADSEVIPGPERMFIFAEKLTNSYAEIDFVDVGKGKENADSKIRRNLAHYYTINQCQKIFIAGCCHDNGYLHDLRAHTDDPSKKIVLVETTPAEPDFRSLGFPIVNFNTVFRAQPLNNETKRTSPRVNPASATASGVTSAAPQPTASSPPPELDTSFPPLTPASGDSPGGAAKAAHGNKVPLFSQAAGTGSQQNISLKTQKKTGPYIATGKERKRVDVPLPKPPKADDPAQVGFEKKLQKARAEGKKGFCNGLYLEGHCELGDRCYYAHSVKLTGEELAIHRFRARHGNPCTSGQDCKNPACPLSHHCPYGKDSCTKSCAHKVHLSSEDMVPVWKYFLSDESYEKY